MAKKTKIKYTKKAKVSKRKYDNTARAEKSVQTQKTIIESLVALLVERRGGDVQMGEVAKRSGITQRTIFRFFKDKESLHQAMDDYLLSYLQASTQQMETMNFIGFAKNAFKIFDQYEDLTTAYVVSPFGHETRALFRRKLTQAMIARISREKNIELTDERLKRLALVTSLVNAKIWYDLQIDFGFTGEEMGPSLEWALKTLLEKC